MGLPTYATLLEADAPSGFWPADDPEADPLELRDLTGNSEPLVAAGGVSARQAPVVRGLGRSVGLDGTGQLESTIAEDWTDPWAWEAWVRFTDVPTASQRAVLFQPQGNDFPRLSVDWDSGLSAPYWVGEVRDASVTRLVTFPMSADDLRATPYGVALVYDGDELRLMLNGRPVDAIATPDALLAATPAPLIVGANDGEADSGVIGRMAGIAVWSDTAPVSRVFASHYDAGNRSRSDPEDVHRSIRRFARLALGDEYAGKVRLSARTAQLPQRPWAVIVDAAGPTLPRSGIARAPQTRMDVIKPYTITVYPSNEGTPRECAVRADRVEATLLDAMANGIDPGGALMIPLYDYEGLELNEPGPDDPHDFLRVADYPIRKIADPEDERLWTVVCDLRVNWRRLGPRDPADPYARAIIPTFTP